MIFILTNFYPMFFLHSLVILLCNLLFRFISSHRISVFFSSFKTYKIFISVICIVLSRILYCKSFLYRQNCLFLQNLFSCYVLTYMFEGYCFSVTKLVTSSRSLFSSINSSFFALSTHLISSATYHSFLYSLMVVNVITSLPSIPHFLIIE